MASGKNARKGDDKAADFARMVEKFLPGKDSIEEKAGLGPERPQPGSLPIQARLDLHGRTLEEARRDVDSFLKSSADSGFQRLIIIHGKGLHSKGEKGGVLRDGIIAYLQAHPLAGKLETAGNRDGGSGATIVYLKRKV